MAKFQDLTNGQTVDDTAWNEGVRAFLNAILDSGQVIVDADNTQMSKALANYSAISDFYTDSGSVNNYVLSSIGSFKAPTQYETGMNVRFSPGIANTGASVVNVESLGAIAIRKVDNSGTVVDAAQGDLVVGRYYNLIYNGTEFLVSDLRAGTAYPKSRDRNLVIENNSTNPAFQIDITFDYLTMYNEDTGMSVTEASAGTLLNDLATTGADGRASSEGAEAANTFYFYYVYSDGAGAQGTLASTNSDWASVASGDKPAAATYVRRVSSFRNDAGSNLIVQHQYMEHIWFNDLDNTSNGAVNTLSTGNISPGTGSLNLGTLVPAIALAWRFAVYAMLSIGGQIRFRSEASNLGVGFVASMVSSVDANNQFELANTEAGTTLYTNVSGAGVSVDIHLDGYTFPL